MTGAYDCNFCISNPNSIFNTLTEEDNTFLNSHKSIENFSKGHIVYYEGSRINGVFYVCKGVLKIYKTGSDGKEQIVTFAKPGSIIGYRSVLSNEPACTTAQVIEPTQICFIPSSVIFHFVRTNGEFSLALMKMICKELDQANVFIKDIAQKNVRERLVEILLMLEETFGTSPEGYLNIILTREELANIVGTATESAIRLLSELKSEGYISLVGKRIKLENKNMLKKIAKSFF